MATRATCARCPRAFAERIYAQDYIERPNFHRVIVHSSPPLAKSWWTLESTLALAAPRAGSSAEPEPPEPWGRRLPVATDGQVGAKPWPPTRRWSASAGASSPASWCAEAAGRPAGRPLHELEQARFHRRLGRQAPGQRRWRCADSVKRADAMSPAHLLHAAGFYWMSTCKSSNNNFV